MESQSFDISRFVTLVCRHGNRVSSLTERFMRNFDSLFHGFESSDLQRISAEEFSSLFDIFYEAKEPTLAGCVYFLQRRLNESHDVRGDGFSSTSSPRIEELQTINSSSQADTSHDERIATLPQVSDSQHEDVMLETARGTKEIADDTIECSETIEQVTEPVTDQQPPFQQQPLRPTEIETDDKLDYDVDVDEDKDKTDQQSVADKMDENCVGESDVEEIMELPVTLNRSIVEDIIDHMRQDNNEPYTDSRKQYIKIAFEKMYDANGVFDLERALQKTMVGHIGKFNSKTYISYMQSFKKLLRDACEEKILAFAFDESKINKTISLVCNAHQCPNVKKLDTYTAPDEVYPSWSTLRERVDTFVEPILKAVQKRDYDRVNTEDLKTAIRAMLYVSEHPPRRDEYRLLVQTRPPDANKVNQFNTKYGKIRLEDYAADFMYGVFEIRLSDDTSDLMDELCRRQEDAEIVYIFGNHPKDAPSDIDWEEACINDFLKICKRGLDTLALRTIYLTHIRTSFKNDPIKRIETVADMGHSLQEHFNLLRINPLTTTSASPKKRKTESSDVSANKSRRVE